MDFNFDTALPIGFFPLTGTSSAASVPASVRRTRTLQYSGRSLMVVAVGARPIMAPGWSGGVHTVIALVDCDVHQTVHKMDDLIPHMSRVYRQQATEQGIRMAGSGYFNVAIDAGRTDLATDCDAQKHDVHDMGSSFDLLKEQHLDLWNVDKVLLTGASTYGASILPDPDFAADLCRAFNDWTIEHWLERDDRLMMAMSISVNDPRLAVAEIERLGPDPGSVREARVGRRDPPRQ